MKQLPLTYNKYGYRFDLYTRLDDIAVYEQSDPKTGKVYAYEVFIVQKNEAGNRFGRDIEASESVPSTNEWGRDAFTVWTLDEATEKVAYLQQRLTERLKNQLQRGSGSSNLADLLKNDQ